MVTILDSQGIRSQYTKSSLCYGYKISTWHGKEYIREEILKWSSSEGTDAGAADSNWTWGLCWHYYDYFEETLNHLKSIKLNSYPGDNVKYWCAAILVVSDHLGTDGAFNTDNLSYITSIFEYTSDLIFRRWEINKYKEVEVLSMGIRTPKLLRYNVRSEPRTTNRRVPRRRQAAKWGERNSQSIEIQQA